MGSTIVTQCCGPTWPPSNPPEHARLNLPEVDSGTYSLLPETTYESFCEFIKLLPNHEVPGVHGLHPNASISYERDASLILVDELTNQLYGNGILPSDCVWDDVAQTAQQGLDIVPECIDDGLLESRRPVAYVDSLNSVLHQEVVRYNSLVRIILSSLHDLVDACKGSAPVSPLLESIATAL